MPACFNLNSRPPCYTRSKALLMSKKTALTSLPLSKALQKVL